MKIQGINITVEPQHHVKRQIYAYFWFEGDDVLHDIDSMPIS
jgi:hypothetical protein